MRKEITSIWLSQEDFPTGTVRVQSKVQYWWSDTELRRVLEKRFKKAYEENPDREDYTLVAAEQVNKEKRKELLIILWESSPNATESTLSQDFGSYVAILLSEVFGEKTVHTLRSSKTHKNQARPVPIGWKNKVDWIKRYTPHKIQQQPKAASAVQSLPIEIIQIVRDSQSGEVVSSQRGELEVTSESLTSILKSQEPLYNEVVSQFGKKNICVLCKRSEPEVVFTKPEHVILRGLGTDWICLPPGITCDTCNHMASKYEGELLDQGTMGFFRPFYLDEMKSFTHKGKKGKTISVCSEEDGRFAIKLMGLDEGIMPKHEFGSGEIRFQLPLNQPKSVYSSIALHKIALLAFYFLHGPLVFATSFDPLRDFILHPSKDNYRPYWERFISRTSPGYAISFFATAHTVNPDQTETIELDTLHAKLKLHHMHYNLSLVGDPCVGLRKDEDDLSEYYVPWLDPNKKREKKMTTFAFGISGGYPVVPKKK